MYIMHSWWRFTGKTFLFDCLPCCGKTLNSIDNVKHRNEPIYIRLRCFAVHLLANSGSVGKNICLEYRTLWVRIQPEVAHLSIKLGWVVLCWVCAHHARNTQDKCTCTHIFHTLSLEVVISEEHFTQCLRYIVCMHTYLIIGDCKHRTIIQYTVHVLKCSKNEY